jgi:hypothetical protein
MSAAAKSNTLYIDWQHLGKNCIHRNLLYESTRAEDLSYVHVNTSAQRCWLTFRDLEMAEKCCENLLAIQNDTCQEGCEYKLNHIDSKPEIFLELLRDVVAVKKSIKSREECSVKYYLEQLMKLINVENESDQISMVIEKEYHQILQCINRTRLNSPAWVIHFLKLSLSRSLKKIIPAGSVASLSPLRETPPPLWLKRQRV